MNSYFYKAKIWQLNNKTDLLAEYEQKHSQNLQNININLTSRCLELSSIVQEGGRHQFEKVVDSIKRSIEESYGRIIGYQIKEIVIKY